MASPGIGNLLSSMAERNDRLEILERWKERCTKRIPGTHTLGKEFRTTDGSRPKPDR